MSGVRLPRSYLRRMLQKQEGRVIFIASEAAERRFMKENRPTSIIERFIGSEEIVSFVTFLSSPLSSAINGSALRIDGGLVRSVF
jgi:3-oxoacyl-[acyl-carrier protein] reductase